MYVYINSELGLWTVGFYSPDGQWHPDSDNNVREEAAKGINLVKVIPEHKKQLTIN